MLQRVQQVSVRRQPQHRDTEQRRLIEIERIALLRAEELIECRRLGGGVEMQQIMLTQHEQSGRFDQLPSDTVHFHEPCAQCLVAHDECLQRTFEPRNVQRASQRPRCAVRVRRSLGRLEFLEQPQSLLKDRQRGRRSINALRNQFDGDRRQRRVTLTRRVHQPGEPFDRRRFEDLAKRQLHAKVASQTRQHLRCKQ